MADAAAADPYAGSVIIGVLIDDLWLMATQREPITEDMRRRFALAIQWLNDTTTMIDGKGNLFGYYVGDLKARGLLT